MHGTDWQNMVDLMRKRLAKDLVSGPTGDSQNPD
jgi:hypothetical protein